MKENPWSLKLDIYGKLLEKARSEAAFVFSTYKL